MLLFVSESKFEGHFLVDFHDSGLTVYCGRQWFGGILDLTLPIRSPVFVICFCQHRANVINMLFIAINRKNYSTLPVIWCGLVSESWGRVIVCDWKICK